uniref:Uncharacterized protein n=1 Tax=Eutreptiella gymnastica TaxID=73025 RepID=A0A6T1QTB0_9EUGL
MEYSLLLTQPQPPVSQRAWLGRAVANGLIACGCVLMVCAAVGAFGSAGTGLYASTGTVTLPRAQYAPAVTRATPDASVATQAAEVDGPPEPQRGQLVKIVSPDSHWNGQVGKVLKVDIRNGLRFKDPVLVRFDEPDFKGSTSAYFALDEVQW